MINCDHVAAAVEESVVAVMALVVEELVVPAVAFASGCDCCLL